MITAGIDCGARTTKVAIMKNGTIIGMGKVLTGFDQEIAVEGALEAAIEGSGVAREDIARIVGTGSGKDAISIADETVNDIKAMAKGGWFFFPNARTVVDVGAEEGRAAKVNDQGMALDFAVNGQCAAGTGAFIEAMARALETPLDEVGPLALTSHQEIPMNTQCAIFAESEVVGLIHARVQKNDISKAIHDSVAGRIVSLIRRVGVNEDVVLAGGVSCNPAFVEAVRRKLNMKRVYVPEKPEFTAAVGAAVLAAEAGRRP